MTTESMGKGIVLTKKMYNKMGQKPKEQTRGGKRLQYSSDRIDPKSHVRFG